MKIFGFIISLSLFALSGYTQDSLQVQQYERTKFIPTGVRVGLDLISLGQGVASNGLSAITQGDARQWKISADIDFYRYFLNIEYGSFQRVWIAPQSGYSNEGRFLKIGPDVNFLHRDPDQSALFVGLRYARSTFSDRLNYDYDHPFWGSGTTSSRNDDLSVRWFEITTGLKVKLWRYIWSGYTARFKFGVSDFYENYNPAPHWIPGYGLAEKETSWAFEYWLIFRIPFREYTPAPPKD